MGRRAPPRPNWRGRPTKSGDLEVFFEPADGAARLDWAAGRGGGCEWVLRAGGALGGGGPRGAGRGEAHPGSHGARSATGSHSTSPALQNGSTARALAECACCGCIHGTPRPQMALRTHCIEIEITDRKLLPGRGGGGHSSRCCANETLDCCWDGVPAAHPSLSSLALSLSPSLYTEATRMWLLDTTLL